MPLPSNRQLSQGFLTQFDEVFPHHFQVPTCPSQGSSESKVPNIKNTSYPIPHYSQLVGDLEHDFYFHILRLIHPTDEFIFFRHGRYSTSQPSTIVPGGGSHVVGNAAGLGLATANGSRQQIAGASDETLVVPSRGLFGALEHESYFPISWECHHPN